MALALVLKRLLFSRSFRPVGGVAQPGSSRFFNTNAGSDDRDVEIEWHPGCEAALKSPVSRSLPRSLVPYWDWNGGKLRYCVDMSMSGLAKENVKVSLEQKTLIITGEDKKFRYTQSIDLTSKLYQISHIKAEMMKNGVLKVFVPYIKIDEETTRIAAPRTRFAGRIKIKEDEEKNLEEEEKEKNLAKLFE